MIHSPRDICKAKDVASPMVMAEETIEARKSQSRFELFIIALMYFLSTSILSDQSP